MSQAGFGRATPFSWVSIYFFSFFFVFSYFLPFWGLWLKSRNISSENIGIILGTSLIVRCLANLLVATQLKNLSHLVAMLRALTLGMLVSCIILLFCGENIWLLAIMTLVFSAFLAPAIPLSDVLAIRYATDKQIDYGKSRQWGSIGFLIGTTISGFILNTLAEDGILWTMILGTGVMLLFAMRTPEPGIQVAAPASQTRQWGLIKLLSQRDIIWFLIIVSLLQGSHAAFYAFSVLHWQANGVDASTIGFLWAMGVVAEIILFYFSWRFIHRFTVNQLLMVAAVGAIIRWSVMASTTALPLLIVAQILHALTFGVCHLASIRYIQQQPEQMAIPLQALYNAFPVSAAVAIMTLITGLYFDALAGNVFWIMMSMGVVSLIISSIKPLGNLQSAVSGKTANQT